MENSIFCAVTRKNTTDSFFTGFLKALLVPQRNMDNLGVEFRWSQNTDTLCQNNNIRLFAVFILTSLSTRIGINEMYKIISIIYMA